MGASLHLSRLPLRRDHGPELQARAEKLRRQGSLRRYETIGRFRDFRSTINQAFKNAYWGIRGNYRSMPTDCPQRDDAWAGSATVLRAVSARASCSAIRCSTKWLRATSSAGQRRLRAGGSAHWTFDQHSGNVTAGGSSLRGRHAL
ncbi:MAG: hypothetical protein ACLR76_02635 [Alistipes sp.]